MSPTSLAALKKLHCAWTQVSRASPSSSRYYMYYCSTLYVTARTMTPWVKIDSTLGT